MADIGDQAQALEEAQRDAALASVRALPCASAASACADCGDDIPPARLKAAPWAVTCIDCQELRERAAK